MIHWQKNEHICPNLTITQNWSIWYRDSIVLAFVYCTFAFAGATGPLLSPIAFDLVVKYDKSFTAVSLLTGYQLLTVAFCGFLVSPATRIFGKRPVLIVCSIIGLAGSIWLIYADTYSSTLGARILQGIGVSFVSALLSEKGVITDNLKYEGVGFGLIADLYFVHERGARIGAFLFPLGAFNVMCPLLSGVVAKNLGIPWMFKLNAIFAGIA